MMEPQQFIQYYRQGFGEAAELPLVFWYSHEPAVPPLPLERCYIGSLKIARQGRILSMNENSIKCGGGKLYAGFTEPRPTLANFVSEKEHYKKEEQLVQEFIADFEGSPKINQWLNFARVDQIDTFEGKEGVIFFATPDILSGLVSWCLYDTNAPDAVSVPFASGCSSITAHVVRENQTGGRRTFLGMFDPSARPRIEENLLTYAIPINRFQEMCQTLPDTCMVYGTHDWLQLKDRINHRETES